METESLIKILQVSVTPCVLISAFGLILLSMTNRIGRTFDRIRLLNKESQSCAEPEKKNLKKQIRILFRRAKFLQIAIGLVVFGVFLVGLTVLLLFSTGALTVELSSIIGVSFVLSMLCLISSLFFFMLDVMLTLKSVRLEIRK